MQDTTDRNQTTFDMDISAPALSTEEVAVLLSVIGNEPARPVPRQPSRAEIADAALIPQESSPHFADLRDALEALIAEHYDSDIMPATQVLVDMGSIRRFMKRHYQDPYVKAKLDPRASRALRDWVRTRPGRIYRADLVLIKRHLSLPGSFYFLFALKFIVRRRKLAAKTRARQLELMH